VVRTRLSALRDVGDAYDFGAATCIAGRNPATATSNVPDPEDPQPGEVFLYMVDYFDGRERSSYGAASAAKPRVVGAGDCP
jgi:hypothetical protein